MQVVIGRANHKSEIRSKGHIFRLVDVGTALAAVGVHHGHHLFDCSFAVAIFLAGVGLSIALPCTFGVGTRSS